MRSLVNRSEIVFLLLTLATLLLFAGPGVAR